jgi:hypothetical protein
MTIPPPIKLPAGFNRVTQRVAELSPCGRFRYLLVRRWAELGPALPVILLNPSKADAERDDATVRMLMRFAWRWQFSGIVLANLYAMRSTDPQGLRAGDRIGPENDRYLNQLLASAAKGRGWALVGWGDQGRELEDFGDRVMLTCLLSAKHGVELRALGETKRGSPWHPLRKSLALQPQLWHGEVEIEPFTMETP